jgi:hypothetical protein
LPPQPTDLPNNDDNPNGLETVPSTPPLETLPSEQIDMPNNDDFLSDDLFEGNPGEAESFLDPGLEDNNLLLGDES